MEHQALPRPAVLLGLAGIAPQALCLGLVLADDSYRWAAVAGGCLYAAIILSFLGGLWWMAALLAGRSQPGIYILAVMPSLAGWAALLPWVVGLSWPMPSLVILGLLLLASPLADLVLSQRVSLPPGWIRLRIVMAACLGALTLALAFAWH